MVQVSVWVVASLNHLRPKQPLTMSPRALTNKNVQISSSQNSAHPWHPGISLCISWALHSWHWACPCHWCSHCPGMSNAWPIVCKQQTLMVPDLDLCLTQLIIGVVGQVCPIPAQLFASNKHSWYIGPLSNPPLHNLCFTLFPNTIAATAWGSFSCQVLHHHSHLKSLSHHCPLSCLGTITQYMDDVIVPMGAGETNVTLLIILHSMHLVACHIH